MSTTDPTTILGDESLVPPDEQTPAIGDNSGAEEDAFNEAAREMFDLNAERKALNAHISKRRKTFKANGIVLKALDETIAMMEWEPAEVREHFAVRDRYAQYAKLPLLPAVGEQIDAFSHAADEEVSKADWKWRGYAAATTGKGVFGVPPDTCPTDRHQDWLEGWHEGQIKNAPGKLVEDDEGDDDE